MKRFLSLDDLRASELYPRTPEELARARAEIAAALPEKIVDKFGIPEQVVEQAQTLFALLRGGDYTKPFDVDALAAAALRYFVGPSDAIPDAAEGTGYLDDSLIFAAVIDHAVEMTKPVAPAASEPAPAPTPATSAGKGHVRTPARKAVRKAVRKPAARPARVHRARTRKPKPAARRTPARGGAKAGRAKAGRAKAAGRAARSHARAAGRPRKRGGRGDKR